MSHGTLEERMVLTVVTDELKVSQAEAFAHLHAWGISYVEFRGLTGGRVPDGDAEEARRLVQQYGMTVTSISPGVFKCKPDEREIDEHLGRLRRTIALCPDFGCQQMIIFTVQDTDANERPPKLAVEAVKEAGRLAAEAGIRLALENEPGYTAVGVRSLRQLIDAVGLDNVGANWDPGNAWPYDPDLDDGPRILGDRVFNVHAKDTAERNGKRVFDALGRGQVHWRVQVDGLLSVSYAGPFVIETHCEPGVEKTRMSIEAARRLLGPSG